jgi:hypothetical protein
MPWRIKTAPSREPVTLGEAKGQLTLETDEDDDLLNRCIAAAREHAEAYCNRGIVEQTVELTLDRFPASGCAPHDVHSCRTGPASSCRACHLFLELPFGALAEDPPVILKYINAAGDETTLVEDTDYSVDAVSVPGRLHLAYGKTWPAARRQWNAVTVEYVVGWTVDSVPAGIKQAMLLLIAQMYEVRSPEVEKALVPIKFSYETLLNPFRLVTL